MWQYTDETNAAVTDGAQTVTVGSEQWFSLGLDIQAANGDIVAHDYVEPEPEPAPELAPEPIHDLCFTTETKFSVRLIGQQLIITPYHPNWEKYRVQWHIDNGLVKAHDWDAPPPEVEQPPTKEQLEAQAKVTRDAAVSANLTALGVEWQCLNDAVDIRKVINDAETIGVSEVETEMFRLADNSWRETTLAELRQVLAAHVVRKRDVWAQFGAWDAGDKTEPFTYQAA
ncbi:hypothetical protein TW81_02235 [Vibrio galatheae]|uniref:DUF4376 domain-containing protein n=1 Tax=Vibrio galatheae TaxID=579748 RepID=A0A0F4NPR4_9VIBR|nr:hypothetical protein [Vibrio galatheae]KJY84833.1 hypothetical protein TW81_02235 [Vibrio galatheae]